MRVLKIIKDTGKRSKTIKHISTIMKKGHPCPLQNSQRGAAAECRRPSLGGGRMPPVKDMDGRFFINFDIFLIFFNFVSVSLIIFRTLMCARLFRGYLFSLFSPIIGKLSISLYFNYLVIFWGCVKLISLAWLLMCWTHDNHKQQQVFGFRKKRILIGIVALLCGHRLRYLFS